MSDTEHGRHEAPDELAQPPRLIEDLRDAIAPRTVVLVLGVLVLQLGFILSYLGAFHAPRPHRLELGVVGPASIVQRFNGLPGEPVHARAYASEQQVRAAMRAGDLPAALVVAAQGNQDRLLLATAKGTSTATAAQQVVFTVYNGSAGRGRGISTTEVAPLQAGDARGLSGFYLIIGWIVGGYLVASLLGVAKGARPATTRRAVIRLTSLVPYSLASGLLGVVIAGPMLGALNGHLVALWLLGALVVFGSAAVTMAFQVLFGVLGIGLTVLVFVVLGNPSAGGAYQPALLPPFWRSISSALPNGAGTDAVRRIVYFDANGIGGHLLVLALYAVLGAAVTIAASVFRHRNDPHPVATTTATTTATA